MGSTVMKEIEYFSDACEKYQRAIVRAYLYRRKKKFLVKEADRKLKEAEEEGVSHHHRHGLRSSEMFLISQLEDVNDYVIERWSQELANRRQYMNFLLALLEEMKYIQQKIRGLNEKLTTELTTVRSLVSNKSSVPKEVVYPRFESVGDIWCKIYEEVVVMVARSNTFQCLNKYRLSFSPTLADELHGDEEDLGADGKAIALSLHIPSIAEDGAAEAKSIRGSFGVATAKKWRATVARGRGERRGTGEERHNTVEFHFVGRRVADAGEHTGLPVAAVGAAGVLSVDGGGDERSVVAREASFGHCEVSVRWPCRCLYGGG